MSGAGEGVPPTDDAAAGTEPRGGRGRLVVGAAIGVLVGGGLLLMIVSAERRPPEMPRDLVHSAAAGDRDPRSCLKCHARDAAMPVPKGHTGRQDCASCH